jgi:predicted transcriptional regulator
MPARAVAKRASSMQDPRHLMRFLRKEAGATPKEIAKAEGVSEHTIRTSIAAVEVYRARNSSIELDLAVRDLAISSVPKAKETLHNLLSATELVEIKDPKTGQTKTIRQDDKTVQLEALKIVNQMVSNLQPKGPLIENNVSQTTQIANLSTAETTEDRMRRLREKAKAFNVLPPEVAGVPESIDSGEDDDDEEEDEDE